jgi:hypothetical protein
VSVLDDVFAALAQPANGTSIILRGVATLSGTISFADDGPGGPISAACYVVATGMVQTESLIYAPPRAGKTAAVRFLMPLHYVWPASLLATESTAVTLTKNATAQPSYTIDFALPWTDVAFTATVDAPSGVIYGSANNALLALALSLAFEPQPRRKKPFEAVPAGRSAFKRSRENHRR